MTAQELKLLQYVQRVAGQVRDVALRVKINRMAKRILNEESGARLTLKTRSVEIDFQQDLLSLKALISIESKRVKVDDENIDLAKSRIQKDFQTWWIVGC